MCTVLAYRYRDRLDGTLGPGFLARVDNLLDLIIRGLGDDKNGINHISGTCGRVC